MADSPLLNSEGVLRVTVVCDGTPLADSAALISVQVRRAIGEVASARLVLADGEMPTGDWPLANEDTFMPGAKIRIAAGYGDTERAIFEGLVVKLGVRIAGDNESQVVVECRDPAVKMTLGRKNAHHVDRTDSQVMAQLVQDHGLQAAVESTALTHGLLTQYYCSDWDFLMARAEHNGMVVLTEDGKVVVQAPQTSAEPVLKVGWGVDLIEFRADVDARSQLQQVQAVAWDPKQQAVVSASSAPQTLNRQGNLDGAALAGVLGLPSFRLQTPVPLAQGELTTWSKAQQVRAALARIRGRMKFQGSAAALPGRLIEVAGVGKRYDGQVYVTAVEHELSVGNWITSADFGLAPEWFTERSDVVAPAAAGCLPGAEGLHIATVVKLDGDPAGEQRIQIRLPVLQASPDAVWARLMQFHASSGYGAFFVPEIGDEVVVGFFNHDPSHPVVLGSLYSSQRKPACQLQASNDTKAIVTRGRHKLMFDDKDKVISIVTPGGNTVVLSDKDRSIRLEDSNGNRVELNPDGITLDTPKDLTITAQGHIRLAAQGRIDIAATQDAKLNGLNVSCQAQVAMAVRGSASAELSASGQTTVRGAMVLIN